MILRQQTDRYPSHMINISDSVQPTSASRSHAKIGKNGIDTPENVANMFSSVQSAYFTSNYTQTHIV